MNVVAGDRRIVTVLFADVVGSTGIGERLGPERSKLLLDEVMRLMGDQVARHGGTVAQLVGDAMLALFGAPTAHEDDSERAVRAALTIQHAVERYAGEVKDAYGVALGVRIGVNTGPVVVPDGPDEPAERYNALGDTVNVAARLQALAPSGGVVLAPETARQVEEWFDLDCLGAQELRGVSAPLELYRVIGERAASPERAPALPLLGRDLELAVVERALEGLADGRGVIVSVSGEPGIGKSRLVREAQERVRGRVLFVEGRAVAYGEAFPYWPVRDLLREWLGVGVTTPEARVRLELKAQLPQHFGARADEAYTFLASLLGVALEPDAIQTLRELNRESRQHRTFGIVAELVRRIADEQPLCLVLEDLHWADESTFELLMALMPIVEEAALGLVLVSRTEREHGSWRLGELARQRYPHRYRELELRPLPEDASRALVAGAAEGELPPAVAQLLTDRAGGNPFFLEEAMRDLLERGALVRRDGHLELAMAIDELAVPTVVQGALQARLDRLDAGTREVLSIAAVIGRTFGLTLLERLVDHDQLMAAISELQRLDLVVEKRRRPTPEYRFRHGLVSEVAYAQLVETARRRLHLRVGEALEELLGDSPEQPYGLLAHHFAAADDPERAARYLLLAGDAARALYADAEALRHYRRARAFLARIGDPRRERELLFKIGLAHHLAFNFAEAELAYDEALACRVVEEQSPAPTERLEVSSGRPDEVVPGHTYWTEGMFFIGHLFRGLLAVDEQLNVLPSLADNFRVSGDGLTYLFRLREDARWSDGVRLKASDFVFAWDRIRAEDTKTAFMLEEISEAVALDDRTLEITLREPRNYFPYTLASAWSFPWPQHKVEELGDDWRLPENLVSNGPFTIAEYDEHSALLVANSHWQGSRGNVRELRVVFHDEFDSTVDHWREGAYDVLETNKSGYFEDAVTIAQIVPKLTLRYVGFTAHRRPFCSVELRRAFGLAIDREQFVAGNEAPAAPATGGAIPVAMPGHSPGLCAQPDLAEARRLLAVAGYPDGKGLPELTLAVPFGFNADGLLEAWAALGARVRVFPGEVCSPEPVGDFDMWVGGWVADFPDPDGFFRGLSTGSGWPFYADEELRDMLDRARSLQDRDLRMALYHDLDRMLVVERAALAPLDYPRSLVLRRPWVGRVAASPLTRVQLDQVVVTPRPAPTLPAPASL